MGQLLAKYYKLVESEGGVPARMRLAMITGVPSSKAEVVPDSPELVTKFKKAAEEIIGKKVSL